MSKLVVLRRCATLEEALVVDSLLQDGGFLSSTPMRYHAQNNWLIVPALNGIPVYVPEAELLEAAAYLIEMCASAKERLEGKFGEIDPSPWKRRPLRRWSLLAKEANVWFFIALPILWLMHFVIGTSESVDWLGLSLWYLLSVTYYVIVYGALMWVMIKHTQHRLTKNMDTHNT